MRSKLTGLIHEPLLVIPKRETDARTGDSVLPNLGNRVLELVLETLPVHHAQNEFFFTEDL